MYCVRLFLASTGPTPGRTFPQQRQVARDPLGLPFLRRLRVHVRGQQRLPPPQLHDVARGAVSEVEERGRRRRGGLCIRMCTVESCESMVDTFIPYIFVIRSAPGSTGAPPSSIDGRRRGKMSDGSERPASFTATRR